MRGGLRSAWREVAHSSDPIQSGRTDGRPARSVHSEDDGGIYGRTRSKKLESNTSTDKLGRCRSGVAKAPLSMSIIIRQNVVRGERGYISGEYTVLLPYFQPFPSACLIYFSRWKYPFVFVCFIFSQTCKKSNLDCRLYESPIKPELTWIHFIRPSWERARPRSIQASMHK